MTGLDNRHFDRALARTEKHPDWLGRVVQAVWLDWCSERATAGHPVKPSHLARWEDMPEHEQDLARRIGVMVYRALRLRTPEIPAQVCHFCGRTNREVKVLVAGVYALICDECVAMAAKVVEEHRS